MAENAKVEERRSDLTAQDFLDWDNGRYSTAENTALEITDGFAGQDDIGAIRRYAAYCVEVDRAEREKLMPCGHPVSDWQPDQASCGGCNEVTAARADERQRVVEECCAAMCARCASGEVAEYREASKNWCHDVYVCRANPIRRALGE